MGITGVARCADIVCKLLHHSCPPLIFVLSSPPCAGRFTLIRSSVGGPTELFPVGAISTPRTDPPYCVALSSACLDARYAIWRVI